MLEGIISKIKTRLFGSPHPTRPTESLDVRISKMPAQYQDIFVKVATTSRMLEQIDSQTKLVLHHVHSLVVDERRGFCFHQDYHGLGYLVGYGLAELRPYEGNPENEHLWEGTTFVHPSKKAFQIHDELEAQGYDFAPPEGAFYDVD